MKAVNLIPAEQRAGGAPVAGESQGAAFIVLGLCAGLAVLAVLYGMASHQISSRRGEVAKITQEAQTMQARANALSPYTTFKAMYEQRQSAVNTLVNTRFDWAHVMHELARVMPAGAALTSVKASVGSPTLTVGAATAAAKSASSSVASATPPGSVPTFTLAGCAVSQSETAETLLRLRLIDGVSTVTLQSSTKNSSGGGTSGGGGCPAGAPAFAITVTFAALPTPAASPSSSAQNAAATTGSASGAGSAASTGSATSSSTSATTGAQ